jgi:para-aminobenzoate synthetase / 4-amino-4-deoxychorismate lyase
LALTPIVALPRGAGTAIFAGGGAWLPRPAGDLGLRPVAATEAHPPGLRGDEAVLLSDPIRILTTTQPQDLPALLAEVEAYQRQGRYVAGYLAYEAGEAFGLTVRHGTERVLEPGSVACDAIPLAWMGVYSQESAIVVPAAEWAEFLQRVEVGRTAAALAGVKPALNVTKAEYGTAIARVRELIAAGDTYQVNYTVRARYTLGGRASRSADGAAVGDGPAVGDDPAANAERPETTGKTEAIVLDPLEYFLALLIRQPVPYAAFLDLGDTQVLSLSPELFLRRDGDQLESKPMKGTRPRGLSHAADVALAYELAETEKERAENLMIVDMVRNDLGRVCQIGSVHVPALYSFEPYRTVWQTTSTVQGLLRPDTSLAEIMRAVFPGASITGAPKHHTMEIIAAVETEPRGVYTGTVALFSPGGDFTGNIGIRTIVHRRGQCTLGVGSGIVWDATAPAEYEETLAKAAFSLPPSGGEWRPATGTLEAGMKAARSGEAARGGETARSRETAGGGTTDEPRLFETILLDAECRYRYLEDHLARMSASARQLGFPFDPDAATRLLTELAGSASGPLVVRLDLDLAGVFELSTRPVPSGPDAPVTLLVSPFRTDPDDQLLAHKTSRRGFYDREHRRATAEGCFDAVFINRLDKVTEGAITSVFARFGDVWITPPLVDGLLPGIWRAHYLIEKRAAERSLTLPRLLQADEIVVGNSVRGAISVAGLAADPLVF